MEQNATALKWMPDPLVGILKGDERAFWNFFSKKYRSLVARIAKRAVGVVGPGDQIGGLVNEAAERSFPHIMATPERFKSLGHIESYILTTAWRLCLMKYREAHNKSMPQFVSFEVHGLRYLDVEDSEPQPSFTSLEPGQYLDEYLGRKSRGTLKAIGLQMIITGRDDSKRAICDIAAALGMKKNALSSEWSRFKSYVQAKPRRHWSQGRFAG